MKRAISQAIVVFFVLANCCLAEIVELSIDDAPTALDESKLRVHFIDVGTGFAAFIQTPNNHKSIFVDGGKEAKERLVDYLHRFHPKNSVIDLAIVTHADNDHFYGMMKVFDGWDVKEFWNTGYDHSELNEKGYWKKNFLTNRVSTENGCDVKMPLGECYNAGDEVILDGLKDIRIVLLNTDKQPPKRDPISNRRFDESLRRNNASLVFKVVYQDISFLITGDINGRSLDASNDSMHLYECDSEELELVSRHLYAGPEFNLKATVLQIPHHGSNGSSSMAFLNAVNPEYAVIPAGFGHGHPTDEVLFRLNKADIAESNILRTDQGETETVADEILDDTFVFETDGVAVTRLFRIKMTE